MGPVQTSIIDRLTEALEPVHLDVENESHMHNVPPGSESHFKVIAASAAFDGLGLVQRHRLVNRILETELRDHIHALALHLKSPAEWGVAGDAPASPQCLGGSKAEKENQK